MSEQPRILVVDDHPEIRKSVTDYLERNGMCVSAAENAEQMDDRLTETVFDLIVLDIMMPGEDGLSACKRLRKQGTTPILMLTALGDEDDRIVGLDGGADDYLAKPFNPKELLARINAILRRTRLIPQIDDFAGKTVKFAHLELDFDGRTLIDRSGSRTQLTFGEFKLLTLFLQRPRTVLGSPIPLRRLGLIGKLYCNSLVAHNFTCKHDIGPYSCKRLLNISFASGSLSFKLFKTCSGIIAAFLSKS